MPSEKIIKIVDEIKNLSKGKEECYKLIIDPDKTPNITDSKFGGLPYWDMNKYFPTDARGNKMILLAQLNLEQLGVKKPLPEKGILQFFITNDGNYVYGMNFDNPTVQTGFRVIYHDSIDYSITEEEIIAAGIPLGIDDDENIYSPVIKECYVKAEKSKSYCSPDAQYDFDIIFKTAVKNVLGEDTEDVDFYEYLDFYNKNNDEDRDYFYDELSSDGHRMLGYPYFTQSDPREYNDNLKKYDTLLFQIDSEMIGDSDYVLWGDCGVANFFIPHEKLEKLDFSDILYNWDCC